MKKSMLHHGGHCVEVLIQCVLALLIHFPDYNTYRM